MLNLNKIENILIANWTDVINVREAFVFIKQIAHNQFGLIGEPSGVSMTRFEIKSHGFIIWLDYEICKVKITSEILFSISGNIIKHNSIKN